MKSSCIIDGQYVVVFALRYTSKIIIAAPKCVTVLQSCYIDIYCLCWIFPTILITVEDLVKIKYVTYLSSNHSTKSVAPIDPFLADADFLLFVVLNVSRDSQLLVMDVSACETD